MRSSDSVSAELVIKIGKSQMNGKRFLIFGWYAWLPVLLLGIVFYPFIWVYMFVISFNPRFASRTARDQLRWWVMQSAGFVFTKQEALDQLLPD